MGRDARRVIFLAGVLAGSMLPAVGMQGQSQTAMVRTGSAGAATPAGAASVALQAIFPLSEVKRGLTGTAYTVFEGSQPEAMQVEILGVLKNSIGPGEDMILARLKGTKPEYTGVVAGMSGSPVYVDGKLLGAMSFRIGQFSKEPICGITPIEQMLGIPGVEGGSAGELAAVTMPEVEGRSGAAVNGEDRIRAIETPLIFSGYSVEAVQRFGDSFRSMGMEPVAGLGGAGGGAKEVSAATLGGMGILPGSAVSAVIVRGDLEIAATCTVTYVDPKQLLACGHPITQYGPVALPMTSAEVLATLPSPLNAFKIINTGDTIGAFVQDRHTGILGRFGASARMIPVSISIARGSAGAKTYHFEVANHPRLTTGAMTVSVFQTMEGTNATSDKVSYRLSGKIRIAGQEPVLLSSLLAPTEQMTPSVAVALLVNDRFSKIFDNGRESAAVEGVELSLEQLEGRQTAQIESARVLTTDARAGSLVEVEATVRPYRGEVRVVRLPVQLPKTLGAGAVRLLVSDGASVDRILQGAGGGGGFGALFGLGPSTRENSLAVVVNQLNQSHSNERVYVTLLEPEAQVTLDRTALAGVPASLLNVYQPGRDATGRDTQMVQLNGESARPLGSAEVSAALTGSQVLTLQVR